MKKKLSSPPSNQQILLPTTLDNSHNVDNDRRLSRDQVPELMRTNSSKRILNQRPINHPTKTLRMKSLLWVKPSVNVKDLSPSINAQLFPTLIVNLAALSSGVSLGYSAIALPQLKPFLDHVGEAAQQSFHRPFTIDDELGSWIASIFGIGAIFGGFISGFLGSKVGRRKTLMMLAIPDILGWILIASAQHSSMMLIGRFLCGLSAAGYSPAIQIYIAEIAQPHTRGWLSGITVPTLALGTLLAYSLGTVLSWHWVAVIALMFPLLLLPGLVFLSDSPYWYLQMGQDKKALQIMERFRAPNSNALAELLAISDSLRRMESTSGMTYKEMFEQMLKRQYRKPFILLNVLFILMTFSGKYAIAFYAVEIFHKATEEINEYISAIVIGFIKLIGCILYLPAIKHFARRTLLCSSSLVMGTALVLLGLTMYEKGHMLHMSEMPWLPLLCVILYMLADPIGLGSIPFLYSAEFYPSELRSLLGGITIGLSNLEMFLVVKTFPNMNHTIGNSGTFWLYAAVCFMTIFYTFFFIPETKEKSLQEIEEIFSQKNQSNVSPYLSPSQTPGSVKKGVQPYQNLSLQFTL